MLRGVLVALGVAVAVSHGVAVEPISVRGTSVTYPQAVTVPVKDRTLQLNLTGVGVRTRIGLNVYAVGSYVQDGATVRTAEDMTNVNAVRVLHLVMERGVDANDFIGAFKAAVGKSYPADKFKTEFGQLADAVGNKAVAKGDHIFMISEPDVGVRFRIADKVDLTVKNPAFAQALWEVYFGQKPLDETLKKGLVGLLPR